MSTLGVGGSTSHADKNTVNILNAQEIPPREMQQDLPDVPVRARIVWEEGGEQWFYTFAYAFVLGMILVETLDRRAIHMGCWLPIEDVIKGW